jgi:hypothetical protein
MCFLKLFVVASGCAIILSVNVFAQEEKKEEPKYGWQNEIVGNLNLTQTSFDNWTQGGESNLAWQLNFNTKFINNQEKFNWSNTGKFSLGRAKLGNQEARTSIDEIRLESVYTYKLNPYVNPYISGMGQTQVLKGYNYTDTSKTAISNFFDPAYFTESIGIGYSKTEDFSTRLGAALKQTITKHFPIPYADNPSTSKIEKTKNEVGAESMTNVNLKVAQNILFTTNLHFFTNFKTFNQIDVNWDNLLVAKVNKYVEANFNVRLFYDHDISKKRQLKQSLALGLTYTFL